MRLAFKVSLPIAPLMCVATLLLVACGGPVSNSTGLSAQQLLTEIEQVCLEEGERSRERVAGQIACDHQSNAELTLNDSAVCTCQRSRLERDFPRDELEQIAALSRIESRISALNEENVSSSSPLVLDLNKERSAVIERISRAKISQIMNGYSVAKRICDDQKSAELIARGV